MHSSWFDLDWVMPDLDALDYEGYALKDKDYLNTKQYNELGILSGFWERLISLMDVSSAAIALIDEDQQDAVHDMGMYFQLHSCGKNEALVPAYIAAGVDLWCPQPLNDIEKLAKQYKDLHIIPGFSDTPQAFSDELYRISRQTWVEE